MHVVSIIGAEQQDENVFAALSAPLLIDVYGNLYALRSDGATVRIDRPGATNRVRFFRPFTSKSHKWVATNEKIYCLIGGARKFLVKLDAASFLYTDIVPQYSPVFSLHGQREVAGLSTLKGLACLNLGGDPAAFGVHPAAYGLGGWADAAGTGYVVGMDRRRRPQGEGHKRGEAVMVRFDRDSGKVTGIDRPKVRSDVIAAFLKQAYPVGRRTSFSVECWLDAVLVGGEALLVGGVVDTGLVEDKWVLPAIPSDIDFNIVTIAAHAGGRVEPKAGLYPYRFLQSVIVGQEAFLYLVSSDASADKKSVASLRAVHLHGRGSISDPRPLRFEGLRSTLPLSFIDLHYDERVGFYGAFVLTRTFASHECYLCRSEDGVNWSVLHPLAQS